MQRCPLRTEYRGRAHGTRTSSITTPCPIGAAVRFSRARVEDLFIETNRERPEIETLTGVYTYPLPAWFLLQLSAFVAMVASVGPTVRSLDRRAGYERAERHSGPDDRA